MSQAELAKKANVGLATLQRMEAATDVVRGNVKSIERIAIALEAAGIVFIEQDGKNGPGVRLREPIP